VDAATPDFTRSSRAAVANRRADSLEDQMVLPIFEETVRQSGD